MPMKTAIISCNQGRSETGETIVFLNAKEVAHILESLTLAKTKHPRRKLLATLVSEFEMIPCAKIPEF